jgi:signal transduction histidine kinase
MLELQAAHPGVPLRLDAGGNLVGHWDADRLSQVVSNLIANAIQHGDGSPVSVRASGSADGVTLAVHNSGPPIPPEAMAFIFEPLARGEPDGQAAGSNIGLGLFIARAVVAAHGGKIGVSSSSASGTTFTVQLPRNPVSAASS